MQSDKIISLSIKTEKILQGWNNTYKREVSKYIQEHITVFEGIRKNFEVLKTKQEQGGFTDTGKLHQDLSEFHTNNLILLKSLHSKLKTKSETRDFLETFKKGVQKDIDCLETNITDAYNTGLATTDKGIGSIGLLKNAGNFFYHFRTIPRIIRNGFAKLFKKPLKPLKQRDHTIYYQQIVQGFLLNDYILTVKNDLIDIQKKLAKLAYELFEQESSIINSNYQLDMIPPESFQLKDINEGLSNIERFYDTYNPTFLTLLEKSGTWEFPWFYIRFKKNWNYKHICEQVDAIYKLWNSTFYALYEDWRFREALFIFVSAIKNQQSEVIKNYSTKLATTLNPVITKKRAYLEQLIERIPNPKKTDHSSLKQFFTKELYALEEEIRKQSIVEDFNKSSSEIEKLLLKIEVDVDEALHKMPDKSGVVRSPNYEKGIRKSEIYFFSPNVFIDYKCVPPFLNSLKSTIENFKESFQKIINEFSDFDQIIDFSLDTAVSMLNSQSRREDTVLMFKEGMKRSLNILNRITEISNDLERTREKELADLYLAFIENIKELDNNDSILKIYSSLLKSRAIQESKDKRKKVFGYISLSITFLGSFLKNQIETIISYNTSIRKKLKLDKAPVFVSSEISNYLADINKRIYKLPVIYRYLFENAPVKEVNLFLSRQKELEKIDTALKNWKLGNYAATLVIGENGGGKSSLLQHYIKTIKESYKVYYFTENRFYHKENDFIELMQDILDNKNLKNEQDVVELIDSAKGQQIIVLDGLERIFLRKPGGFDCMHKLLSFIVSTNSQALWICSVSQNACNYLNKTISLKENFDYIVELDNLTSDEIRKIVLKRHRLSGYIVQYEDDIKTSENNKNTKDRQSQLEKDFFMELNRFSNSNISLSLYYWMESISKFTDKELFIKRFISPDFAFLETLSAEKIYTLLLIVLHGKITVDIHAAICNQSAAKSLKILTILKEDSLLILKGDNYMLNGILYRHVVQLLKSRNLTQ